MSPESPRRSDSPWGRALQPVGACVTLALLVLVGCAGGETAPTPAPAAPRQPPPAATRITPEQQEIYVRAFERGRQLLAEGNDREAVAELSVAAGVRADDARLLRMMGSAFARLGDLPRARRNLEASIRVDAMTPGTYYELARVCLMMGDLEAALEPARRTLALDPGSSKALEMLGMIEYRLGDVTGARAHLEAAVARDPQAREAHLILGFCREHLQELGPAAESFREVIRLDPANADAYAGLTRVLPQIGDPAGANAAREKLDALDAAGGRRGPAIN
jgi:Flp pilus assembly protein TadD